MKLGCQARSFGAGIYPDEESFLSVVHQIGQLGFEGIEANWRNMERYFDCPDDFRERLLEAGLQLVGAHYGGPLWDASARDTLLQDVERIAPFVAALGGEAVVCSGGRPPGESVPTETWRNMAACLDGLGQVCSHHGLNVAYHNHWWESEVNGLDQLAEQTNSNTVVFAFDTGHHTRAGEDAADMIRRLGPRLNIIHLADYADGDRPVLGTGDLDLQSVSLALHTVGFDGWLVLEEQTTTETAPQHVAGCLPVMRQVAAEDA